MNTLRTHVSEDRKSPRWAKYLLAFIVFLAIFLGIREVETDFVKETYVEATVLAKMSTVAAPYPGLTHRLKLKYPDGTIHLQYTDPAQYFSAPIGAKLGVMVSDRTRGLEEPFSHTAKNALEWTARIAFSLCLFLGVTGYLESRFMAKALR